MKKVYLNTLTTEEIIKRLKDGELVKRDDRSGLIYKMIDGVIIIKDSKGITLGGRLLINEVDYLYFEEEEPFEIEETGVYKTRDGRKAYVYQIKDETDTKYPICYVVDRMELSVTKQGRYCSKEAPLDIIAKWED